MTILRGSLLKLWTFPKSFVLEQKQNQSITKTRLKNTETQQQTPKKWGRPLDLVHLTNDGRRHKQVLLLSVSTRNLIRYLLHFSFHHQLHFVCCILSPDAWRIGSLVTCSVCHSSPSWHVPPYLRADSFFSACPLFIPPLRVLIRNCHFLPKHYPWQQQQRENKITTAMQQK